jgi:hypothetical protein
VREGLGAALWTEACVRALADWRPDYCERGRERESEGDEGGKI